MKRILFYSFVLTLVISFISPLNLIDANRDDFDIENGVSFLINLASMALLFYFCALLIFGLAIKLSKRKADRLIFVFLVVLSLWAMYFPLPIGKLDGVDDIVISRVNFILGILVGILAYCLHKRLFIMLPLMLVGPLVLACLSMYNNIEFLKGESANEVLNVSANHKNIFVVSFDALQPEYVSSVLESDEELRGAFDGFVNYKNAVGVAPFTILSTVITKLGHLPKVPSNHKLFVRAQAEKYITTKLAKSGGYDVETYSFFNRGELAETNQLKKYNIKNVKFEEYYLKAFEASFFKIYPFNNAVSSNVKQVIRKLFPLNEWSERIKLDPHPLARNKQDIDDYDAFVSSLKLGAQKPTFRMHHYVFTHAPASFSSNCQFRISNTVSRKDFVIQETACAVSKMREFLAKLTELDILDNSMVFFVSDHGYECGYNKPGAAGRYKVDSRWCLSRYKPLIMVKDFEADGAIRSLADEVSLIDVSKTICSSALDSEQCESFAGYDLFSNNKENLLGAKRPILIGKNDKDDRDYSGFYSSDVGRDRKIEDFFDLK